MHELQVRPLTKDEIDLLNRQSNQCFSFSTFLVIASDPLWRNVHVVVDKEDSVVDLSAYRCCTFIDSNVISSQRGVVSYDSIIQLPSSVTFSVFKNCILFPDCYIYQNTFIENAVILENSIIMGCGRICCQCKI